MFRQKLREENMFCYTSMSDKHRLMHTLETDLKPSMMASLCNPCKNYSPETPDPEVIKLFSCSTQLSMNFFLLKMLKCQRLLAF